MAFDVNPLERDLPGIWANGYHPDRIDWYLTLVRGEHQYRGGKDDICELVAAMLMESGLNNLTIGQSAKKQNVGVGWMQLDTGYHVRDLQSFHWFRADPLHSLQYVLNNSDLCYQGAFKTHLNKQRWHAWEKEKIDPSESDVWNPLEAVHDRWV